MVNEKEYDTYPVTFPIGKRNVTVFFVTESNESRVRDMGYSWGVKQNMPDDIKGESHYLDGGVYPPSVPGSLRAFWATLVAGRDMSDSREVLDVVKGVLRATALPDDARLQLIDGMMWERDRIIAWQDSPEYWAMHPENPDAPYHRTLPPE